MTARSDHRSLARQQDAQPCPTANATATATLPINQSPKALDESKTALARRMHASGESAIGTALGVSPATVYSVFADDAESGVYA